jgi:redox-sensitive bicupin YhaK (pirin superfamily)
MEITGMKREVERIVHAPKVSMGAMSLRQPLPIAGLPQVSPFILLHHFDFVMEPGHNIFDVPAHPHRGFSPITYIFEGAVEHQDSLGNTKVISNNEVQWITAGRGLIHSEKAGKEFAEKGGRFQGVQLWINLPSSQKMQTPSYQPLTSSEIVLITNDKADLRLVSGIYEGQQGPAKSDVFTAMLRMQVEGQLPFNFPESDNAAVYILEGDVLINEVAEARQNDLVIFKRSPGTISIKAIAESKLLVLAGKPIDEPLVTHGPFVMNSQTEILEAMKDYQDGKMGFLY